MMLGVFSDYDFSKKAGEEEPEIETSPAFI
jgi:hypothetical protein